MLYLLICNRFVLYVVLTQIMTGVKNDGDDLHLTLEQNIVNSWTRDCQAKGRADCITPS